MIKAAIAYRGLYGGLVLLAPLTLGVFDLYIGANQKQKLQDVLAWLLLRDCITLPQSATCLRGCCAVAVYHFHTAI